MGEANLILTLKYNFLSGRFKLSFCHSSQMNGSGNSELLDLCLKKKNNRDL